MCLCSPVDRSCGIVKHNQSVISYSAAELTVRPANGRTLLCRFGCCSFSFLLLYHLFLACIYGLWNEPATRKAADRRAVERNMALSIRLLNWNIVSFRHILTNGPASLFVYLFTAGSQTNPCDFTCRLTYVIVMPTQCLLARNDKYLTACLLGVRPWWDLSGNYHDCSRLSFIIYANWAITMKSGNN